MSKAKNNKRPGFVLFHDVMERIKEFPIDKGMFIITSIYEASKAISDGLPAEPFDVGAFDDKWMGRTAQNLYDEVVRGIETVNTQYNYKVSCGAIGGEFGLKAKDINEKTIEELLEIGCAVRDVANVKKVSVEEVQVVQERIKPTTDSNVETAVQETAKRFLEYGFNGQRGEIAALIRPFIKANRKNMMNYVEAAVKTGIVKDCENLKKHLADCDKRYQF